MRSAVSRCSTSAASPSSTAAYPARSWTPCAIFVPQAREHELQKWRLDAVFVALARGEAASRNAELDPPYSHLVEHLVHQLRLDRDPIVWRNEGVVPLDRTEDGRPSGRSVEALEAQPIRKQIRNRSFQRVESGERGLDQRCGEVARPGRKDNDLDLLLLAQSMCNPRAQDGALPDPAGPVQDGDACSHEVGGDDLAIDFASEEEERIEIRVFERGETLVRRGRSCDGRFHAGTSAGTRPT